MTDGSWRAGLSGITAALGLWLIVGPSFAATTLTLGAGSGAPGGAVLLPVTLVADSPVIAAQFDLNYSSALLTSDGVVALQSLTNLAVVSRELKLGVRRVLIYTRDNSPLPTGIFLNVPLNIATNAAPGTTPLFLSNLILSDPKFGPITSASQTGGSLVIAPKAPAKFQSALFDPDGIFRLELSARTGNSYMIQVSADLNGWTPLITQVAVDGFVRFRDTNSTTLPHHYYRALSVP